MSKNITIEGLESAKEFAWTPQETKEINRQKEILDGLSELMGSDQVNTEYIEKDGRITEMRITDKQGKVLFYENLLDAQQYVNTLGDTQLLTNQADHIQKDIAEGDKSAIN